MRIGLQLLCGLVLIFALAAWFVLEIFVEEIKPGVRSATEDTLVDMAQMLAPLALYPDALLAQVLMASTYPGQVNEAVTWSKANPKASGDDAVKQVAKQPWDPSVQSLVAFPAALATLLTLDLFLPGGLVEGGDDLATARTLGQTMGAALVALVFGLFDFSGGGAADAADALGQRHQRRLTSPLVAGGTHLGETGNLALPDHVVVDFERFQMVFGRQLVFVDADDDVFALVHARLTRGGGFFDQAFGHSTRDRLGHTAEFIDFADDFPGLIYQFVRQCFDIIAAA